MSRIGHLALTSSQATGVAIEGLSTQLGSWHWWREALLELLRCWNRTLRGQPAGEGEEKAISWAWKTQSRLNPEFRPQSIRVWMAWHVLIFVHLVHMGCTRCGRVALAAGQRILELLRSVCLAKCSG